MRVLILTLLTALWGVVAAAPLQAQQQQFQPAILVNGEVITYFELQQRALLLRALNTPGDHGALAQEQLIEDRLKLQEARRVGLVLGPDGQQAAMEEFAGRANLTLPEFLQALAAQGVDESALRDLVTSGVTWRDYIRQRFAREGQVSEAEIDSALATSGSGSSNIRVLISEIIMPAPPPQAASALARAQRIAATRDPAAFSAAAREVSALPSRANGGRLDWMALTDLPPVLQPIILGLSVNEVTPPLQIPNAVALFQLRGIQESGVNQPTYAAVEYATFYIDGGLSDNARREAALIDARTDTCDDLYGVARGLPPDLLERQSLPPAQIPTDVAMELSKLDPGETSAVLTRNEGGTLMLLMLCGRTPALDDGSAAGLDREAVRNQIRARRLNGLADALLAELRASADIRTP